MELALWIVSIALALAFVVSGGMKVVVSRDKLAEKMTWASHVSPVVVKLIGLLEVLGGLGLVLPPLLGLPSALVPMAAIGLMIIMVGAVITHLRLREGWASAAPAIVLGLLALFVAWGRIGS